MQPQRLVELVDLRLIHQLLGLVAKGVRFLLQTQLTVALGLVLYHLGVL